MVVSFLNNFYPRSPCGERQPRPKRVHSSASISIHALLAESDIRLAGAASAPDISIHALLAESDGGRTRQHQRRRTFLSTLSLRRATPRSRHNSMGGNISIHALLAESDVCHSGVPYGHYHFYPRSPCGERREPTALRTPHHIFLSTLSLRRATAVTLSVV